MMILGSFKANKLASELLDHSKYSFSTKKVEDYKLPLISDVGDYLTFQAALERIFHQANLKDFMDKILEDPDAFEWAVAPPIVAPKAKAAAGKAAGKAPAKAAPAVALTPAETAATISPEVRALIAQQVLDAMAARAKNVPVKAGAAAGPQAKATAQARQTVISQLTVAAENAVTAMKAVPAKPGPLAPEPQIVINLPPTADDPEKSSKPPGPYRNGRGQKSTAEFVPKGTALVGGRHQDDDKIILDSTQMSHFRVLFSRLQACLQGRAKSAVDKVKPESAVDILWVLRKEFGVDTLNEKSKLNTEFSTKKWIPRSERLDDWAQRKHWILTQLKDQNPSETVLNANMIQILWTSMPESWNTMVNHGRQMGTLDTYQKVISYLRGYEELEFPRPKDVSGRAYVNEAPSGSTKSKKKKGNSAGEGNVVSIPQAFKSGNFAGLSMSDFDRFVNSKVKEAEQRGRIQAQDSNPANFGTKGKKGGGKGKGGKGKSKPDFSKVTCWDCGEKGHMKGWDQCPNKGKSRAYAAMPTKEEGKTGKKKNKNPAVGGAPYN